jgi:hypothetical protein
MPIRPPSAAPARNASKEVSDRAMEGPGVPATAKARNITLLVMLAGEDAAEPEEADGVDEPGDKREDQEGGRQRSSDRPGSLDGHALARTRES